MIAIVAVVVGGCMTVPARYRQPAQVYPPQIERVAVAGFSTTEYEAVDGRTLNDANALRWLLEDTGCVRQVAAGSGELGLRIEGDAYGERHYGLGRTMVRLAEACTIIGPYIGLPFPGAADGMATARLYRDGRLVKQYTATSRVGYWTWIYVYMRADRKGIGAARWAALRELADQVAADLCRGPRVAATR